MNNSKNRMLIFLVALLLVTNMAMLLYFTVFSKPETRVNSRNEKRGPGITAVLQNDLGFTKQQMEQLDSLKKQHRNAIKPLFDALGKSKDSFYLLVGKPGVSDSLLQRASDDIGKKQSALDLQFFKNFASLRQLCTPAQLPKFDSIMPSLASKMMQPWQKNNGPRRKDSTQQKK